MRIPEPRLRCRFSFGGASPKKRLKKSSMGSLEPERAEYCDDVEIFTTTGMVFLAAAANEGGRLASNAAMLAAWRGPLNTLNRKAKRPNPAPMPVRACAQRPRRDIDSLRTTLLDMSVG